MRTHRTPGAHAAQTHLDIAAEALIRGLHQIEREELQRARNEGAVAGALARRLQHELDVPRSRTEQR